MEFAVVVATAYELVYPSVWVALAVNWLFASLFVASRRIYLDFDNAFIVVIVTVGAGIIFSSPSDFRPLF